MKLVREYLDFERGLEPRKGLRIGEYRHGQIKNFRNVKSGDTAIDYADEKGKVIGKMKSVIPLNDDLDGETAIFLRRHDSTGAMDEAFRDPESYGLEPGDKIKLLAVKMNDRRSYVYTYDYDGAYAIWE